MDTNGIISPRLPVEICLQLNESRFFLSSLLNGAFFHPQNVADSVELELVAELLAHPLLDKLVPVEGRKRSSRNDELVPVGLNVVVLGLLS